MASKNEVTLTFAGDTAKLESAFDKVGAGAASMKTSVDKSSKAFEEHGNALTRVGEKADGSERNLIGVHDVIDGTATIMQGPGKQGLVSYIQGWADLAGGIAPLILSLAEVKLSVIANTVAMGAQAVSQGILKVGALAWAAAQWVLNAAMNANPIGLVVLGIIALIAIIEVIIHNTQFFKDLWNDVWGFMKAVGAWFAGPFAGFFVDTWHKILEFGEGALQWFRDLPGMLGRALAKVADFLLSPFRGAFNAIADAWNNTIGSLHWTVPSWVPFVGGNSISAPKLPKYHGGGVVQGPAGADVLAILRTGETVNTAGSSGGTATLVLAGNTDTAMATALQRLIDQRLIRIVVS